MKNYGWVPDLPDNRDRIRLSSRKKLPTSTDLRAGCPAVYDQGDLGSCTANAIAGAFEFDLLKQKLLQFTPSRLFIYYNERVIEKTINSDSGAMIRDGIKTVVKLGVCSEHSYPYEISKFTNKPPQNCYSEALSSKATSYERVTRSLSQFKGCLAAGNPFVFGFSVYENFESEQVANTGIATLPEQGEALLGGHAVLAVGYDDSKNAFLVRNSWGSGWGLNGYFYLPYGYFTNPNLSDDFWTIKIVS